MTLRPIYLDYNATTPVDPDVLKAMLPFLQDEFAEPSSPGPMGRRARDAIEKSREHVAALIGASPDEIVFTSGGTESNNTAIRKGAKILAGRKRVVTTAIEHRATEACCALLQQEGYEIRRVAPGRNGIVLAEQFKPQVDASTALVTVIHAQGDIGTIQPVSEIAAIAKSHGVLMHADAAQSVGKVPVNVNSLGVDLLSITGHKLYGPKGIGALYVRDGIDLPSILAGGGEEHGRRPGSENVPSIVGLGEACRIAAIKLESFSKNSRKLADQLFAKVKAYIPGTVIVGDTQMRLPNTITMLFPEVSGGELLRECPQVAASDCMSVHDVSEQPSRVLIAMGLPDHVARGAVRLSLGRNTTQQDVDAAAAHLVAAWHQLAQSGDHSISGSQRR